MTAPTRPCRVGLDDVPSSVTEALRRHVDRYVGRFQPDPDRMRVLNQLLACRTAALGTHLCVCEACGWSAPVYNPCRNRHCPQCQGRTTALWLQARKERMLPVPHFQVVFTLPAALRPIASSNPRLVYALLFQAAASLLQDLAAQRLEARLGITAVLHTWTTELSYHPHVHLLVTAGGLALDDQRWVPTRDEFLFPGRVMGALFRGRFLEGLIGAFERGDLYLPGDPAEATKDFRSTVRALSKRHARWVVHVEPPKGRPVEQVAKYLARYVKRIAISDARIVEVTGDEVTFKARGRTVTLDGAEFVRRFLLHVLPLDLRKTRHYGLYAPGNAKVRLEAARRLIQGRDDGGADAEHTQPLEGGADTEDPPGEPLQTCPVCGEARVRHHPPGRAVPRLARGPP